MKESAPKRGAGSDDPTGRDCCRRQDRPEGNLWEGFVRTGSSYAEPNQFSALRASGSSRSQSERGLDLAERSPAGEPEARASGKSGGTRSDRSETSGGAVVAVAVGAVCCGAAGCRRSESLLSVTVGGKERVLCGSCAASFLEKEVGR